jgi:hypothetical protein
MRIPVLQPCSLLAVVARRMEGGITQHAGGEEQSGIPSAWTRQDKATARSSVLMLQPTQGRPERRFAAAPDPGRPVD